MNSKDGTIILKQIKWEDSDREIRKRCRLSAEKLYGDPLPIEVFSRIDSEIKGITGNGYETLYMTVGSLLEGACLRDSESNFHGTTGNSLAAYLLGITGAVNPLAPHYRCSEAHYTEFPETGIKQGCELPDKICPVCGKKLIKDGFSVSEYFFTGFDHNKRPFFSLNVVSRKKEEVLRLIGYMKGVGQIVGCSEGDGVLRHPGGVMLIPDYAGNAKDYMDLLYGRNGEMVSAENYYEGLDRMFSKIDIQTCSQTDHVARVEDLAGIPAESIMLYDADVPGALIQEKSDRIKGVAGIAGLMGEKAADILKCYPVKKFGDLIRVFGLLHGTGVWEDNEKDLIISGKAAEEDIISSREDVFDYMLSHGYNEEQAFSYAERIRMGRGFTGEQISGLKEHGIPDWYIESCNKIRYLFPRAHCIAYAIEMWKLAWYKLHYPELFYRAYLETALISDATKEIILSGDDDILRQLDSLDIVNKEQEEDFYTGDERNALLTAHHMYQNGYEMPGLWATDRSYREYKESLLE